LPQRFKARNHSTAPVNVIDQGITVNNLVNGEEDFFGTDSAEGKHKNAPSVQFTQDTLQAYQGKTDISS
jgi:hypothetical protein